ncbi:MAG: hypothetical protein IPO14_01570 [Saprospiraceae bacterium]|nr:hypothetical protein [Saprospiraceae bacterium]
MKNNIIVSLFFGVVLSFNYFGCTKDKEVDCSDGKCDPVLKVNSKLKFDGQALVIGDFYKYNDTLEIRFLRVNYMFSPLTLDDTSLGDAFHFDFTNKNINKANAELGSTILEKQINKSSSVSLSYGVGLPQKLNNSRPEDFLSTHPLSNQSLYWASWSSYIFAQFEGYVKNKNTGEELSFTYHTGGNESYKFKRIPFVKNFQPSTTNTVNINCDLRKVFSRDGVNFDIMANLQNHATGSTAVSQYIMENLLNAHEFILE